MHFTYQFVLFFLGLFLAKEAAPPEVASVPARKETLDLIAFGSCNKHDKPQPLWKHIGRHKPDLWIWLGDNIYGDTEDMQKMAQKYTLQNARKAYQRFKRKTPIIGIWDDHDYGQNDGGIGFAKKEESQELLLDFLDVPQYAPQRKRAGIYAAYDFGQKGKRIKIILLDTRYFRDSLTRIDKVYQPNFSGSLLGEAQWAWLEKELTDSQADIHIIGSSIQVIAEEHPYEKWANFPQERERFLHLLTKLQSKNTFLLSGDRHIAEVAQWKDPQSAYQLYEITSSGLTHSGKTLPDEANRYRISPLMRDLNFGLIEIDWQKKKLHIEIRGEENKRYYSKEVKLDLE